MSSVTSSKLFEPLQVGDLTLQHRVIMAPLTRYRADEKHAHGDMAARYYGQRAEVSGTLLITEGTFIAGEAGGYHNVPGIWSDEQIEGWKKIVDGVHANGSYIYLQLWALGRKAKEEVLQQDGYELVSASPNQLDEKHGVPRALTKDDIKRYINHYTQAAKNAVFKAGFDGVEIHSANGYLLDQFLQDVSNHRTDEYGGSIENRARFLLEITDAVTNAVGVKKTGIRFSPWSTFNGMRMTDPIPTYSYVLRELVKRYPDLAYVHFVELSGLTSNVDERENGAGSIELTASNAFARAIWGSRTYLSAGGYDPESALAAAENLGNAGIVFGRYFMSNPDLPERLRTGAALTPFNSQTFYSPGPVGYVDYPRAHEIKAQS
ncbi:FMN-linked oxidoreductase [Ceratobasidium sp. AG-I]|nr:FMN-linked oxidoreductase [Ceratobasidium sp. AG-I]